MFSQELLQLLSDNRWHSGEAIGERFNVSRAAIWKQIESIRSYGLTVEADRGKGYRLCDTIQLCDASVIQSLMASPVPISVESELSVDSTNTQLLNKLTAKNLQLPFVLFADHQTAGRGRRGRAWVSPLGRSLYFSLAWRFNSGLGELSGLSLVVAIAIKEALDSCELTGVELKWPNDLIAQSRKLGGILIELQGEATGPCDVVIGVGLNVSLSDIADDFCEEISQPWIDLKQLSPDADKTELIDRNHLAAKLVDAIATALLEFQSKGFEPFVERWQRADYLQGKPVRVEYGGDLLEGNYLGVLGDGAIQVECGGETIHLNGGEISVRNTG